MGAPHAVVSIPRLRLDVPVLEGTDERTLNRGAGIVGTAPILVVVVLPVDAPAGDPVPVQTAAVTLDALPKAASELPLIGLLGVSALLSGLAVRARCSPVARAEPART